MRVLVYVLIAFIAFAIIHKISNTNSNNIICAEPTESPYYSTNFTLYQDSLRKYFGPLECDLILHYLSKFEHTESLDSVSNFRHFMRFSNTLAMNLKANFQKKTTDPLDIAYIDCEQKKRQQFDWFREVTKNFCIAKSAGNTCDYTVWINLDRFSKMAASTPSLLDDRFIQILEGTCEVITMNDGTKIVSTDCLMTHKYYFKKVKTKR